MITKLPKPNQRQFLAFSLALVFLMTTCQPETNKQDKKIKKLDPLAAVSMANAIQATVNPVVDERLTLSLWGVDSLVADPVSIDIDDNGKLYYTRTNRQKNSEFDIRAHQDWEIESIQLQTVEDKRAFLHKILAPENSKKNSWLKDVNGDGSHDWKDMTVEKEQLYTLEDTNNDGIADQSQLILEDFHDEVTDAAGGILKHGEDLFVDIGPDLWRLNDTDHDGLIDKKTSLSHGYGIHIGFGGHGMSGIEVGPEGKIYWQIGDIGFNGTGPDGKKWEHPNSGVIVRANPDGSDFEVFAYGNRNTHEFVFDEYGNLISEDNDGDHAGESERLVYVVNGADIGWRTNWQFGKYRDPDNNTYKVWMDEKLYVPSFKGQAAYITPTIKNFVNGPTGMLYNPGTALSHAFKNTFFVVEFVGNPSRSGLHAFKLNPKGATFELGETKMIVSGVLATGIDFGPDGALYLADWIEGWGTKDYGRIWKLDANDKNIEERNQTQKLLATDLKKLTENQLADFLYNPDLRVRQKAQFELATRDEKGIEIFKKGIAQKSNQLARVNSIWGISQFARKDLAHAEHLVPLLKDNDPEIRAQAAKWLGDVRYKKSGSALLPLLSDDYSRARFFAAEALGRIGFEPAIDGLIELLRTNNDEDVYIRHAASLALARIGKPERLIALSKDPSKAVRLAAVVALRRMQHSGISAFLKDTTEEVVTEAARAINDDLSIVGSLADLGEALNNYTFKNEAFVRRAINANLRVGSDRALENLIAYASHEESPIALRAEAIAALSTWTKPSVLDRVDGRYRGVIKRDLAASKANVSQALIQLSNSKDKTIRLNVAKAAGKLTLEAACARLLSLLKADPQPEIRSEALKALAACNYANIDNAIQVALADKEKSVRVTALDLLPKMNLEKELMVSLLTNVIRTRTIEEKQAALTTLGSLPLRYSSSVYDELLNSMANKILPSEVFLELKEAIDSTKSTALIDRYKTISKTIAPDSLKAEFQGSLSGGDANKGVSIFYTNQTAQCVRCHTYGDYGGTAGPRLNGVASRLTREQLLEALITPSAQIAPGFGTVSLELTNGKKINGILQEEKPTALIIKMGDKGDTTVSKQSIIKRVNGSSSMPPMGLLLSKKEIRDLVSFLSTLKEND